jgi:hypothetical protein
MKNKILNIKLALIFVFSFGVLCVSLFASREKKISKNLNLKSDTLIQVKPVDTVVSVKGKKVLYIGDSHTTYAYGWQDRLCRRTGMTYINTAVGGKTTAWMKGVALSNINSGFDYCFIWGGANDMAGTIKPHLAVKNVQYIVDLCRAKGVKAIVLTGFDPKTCVDVTGKGQIWQPYPKRYEIFQKMLQDSIVGAKVIKSHFISRKDKDCGDFICHMNGSGHVKMSDSIIKIMKFKTIK